MYPGNPEFSRENNLNLLSESLWEWAIYSSLIPLAKNINQLHWCIWYRWEKSVAGLDTSPLIFFWLVVVLSNCVQWNFQMHAWFHPTSWAIFITRCQTLQLCRCGSGFPGYSRLLTKQTSRMGLHLYSKNRYSASHFDWAVRFCW